MRISHDPNDLVTIEELAISTIWETSALVELLERKGVLTKQDVLAMIQELRRDTATANELRHDRVERWLRGSVEGGHSWCAERPRS